MLTSAQMKQAAKQQVIGSLGTFYLAYVLQFALIILALAPIVIKKIVIVNEVLTKIFQYMISFIILPSFSMGIVIITLLVIQNKHATILNFFEGFRFFLKAILISFFTFVFTGNWINNVITTIKNTLPKNVILSIVFGLLTFAVYIFTTYKSYNYRMVYYILAENPQASSLNCITASKNIMKGNKASLFFLDISLYWWFAVSLFVALLVAIKVNRFVGVGIILISTIVFVLKFPYYDVTYGNFYVSIRKLYTKAIKTALKS